MSIVKDLHSFLSEHSVTSLTKQQFETIVTQLSANMKKLGDLKCSEAHMATVVVQHVPSARIQLNNYLISLQDKERELICPNSIRNAY